MMRARRTRYLAGVIAVSAALLTGSKTIRAEVLSEPCCNIVAIDIKRGIVTARETATGFTFRIEVKNKRHLAALKVGTKVWADFGARKVRLEVAGVAPCCNILDPKPAEPVSKPEAPIP